MRERRVLVVGAAATGTAIVLFLARFPWIVGPPSWRWTYAANPLWPRALGALGAFALLAAVAWAWTRREDARAGREASHLGAVVALAFVLDIAFLGLSPLGLATLPLLHLAPWVTGYFWSARAARALPELLASYPDVVTHLSHHAKTHPPGLVALNRLLLDAFRASAQATEAALGAGSAIGLGRGSVPGVTDAELATLIAMGLLVVAAASVAIVPAYLLGRRLYGAPAGRSAALLLAVTPSFLLFAGEFDTIYPLFLLCALLLVGRDRGRAALVAAGAILGLAGLLTFVAAFFVALAALADLLLRGARPMRERVARLALLAAGFAAPLLLFEALTGCSIPRVFAAAFTVQHEVLIPEQRRRWLTWILWNMEDFFLFIGPATALLFAREAAGAVRAIRARAPAEPFALAVLLLLVGMDLSGLIPAETSRVWIFLVPLVSIVALRRGAPCGPRGLLALLALAFALALAAKGSLLLIDVKPPA
jgi:hypothetical protein